MRLIQAVVLLSSIAIVGCASDFAPKNEVSQIKTISGNYKTVAACAYEVLQHKVGPVSKVDLNSKITVERSDTGVTYWILEVRPDGDKHSSLGLRPGPWIITERLYSNEIIPFVVASCT